MELATWRPHGAWRVLMQTASRALTTTLQFTGLCLPSGRDVRGTSVNGKRTGNRFATSCVHRRLRVLRARGEEEGESEVDPSGTRNRCAFPRVFPESPVLSNHPRERRQGMPAPTRPGPASVAHGAIRRLT